MASPNGNYKCQNLRDNLQLAFTTKTDKVEYGEPIQNNLSFQNLDNEAHKLPNSCHEVASTGLYCQQ